MKNIRNQVQLVGRLGQNPEIINMKNGSKLAKISLATNDIYNNAEGEKVINTQWHRVIAWGKTAEIIEQYLQKGNKVVVHGKLSYKSYEDKTGIKRNYTEVVINELMMLGGANKKEEVMAAA